MTNESFLEKILKPARINPVTLSGAIVGWSVNLYSSNNLHDPLNTMLTLGGSIVGGSFLGCYLHSLSNYYRDRKIIKENGFDKRHGERRMGTYCSRQAFNVACIENGYREEVSKLIEETPNEDKAFWYLPHI